MTDATPQPPVPTTPDPAIANQPAALPPLQDLLHFVDDLQGQLHLLRQKITQLGPIDHQWIAKQQAAQVGSEGGSRYGTVIEGVFDGQHMVGPDGKTYTIPANYASKSKLVEGDILKLTITTEGSLIYKQIGPVDRKTQQGTLVLDEATGNWRVVVRGGRSYRILTASVTYYKGQPGDTALVITPEHMPCSWAAVEAIMPGSSTVTQHAYEGVESDQDAIDQLYGGLDEQAVMDGEALLPDGSAGELPPMHHELPPESNELSAPQPAHTETESDDDTDQYYNNGSKPFHFAN